MYDELVKRLRNRRISIQQLGTHNDDPLLGEAADAIEELSKRVPKAPHGRLIDADAFEKHIKEDWNEYDKWIAAEVEHRPTVIEAEEENT